jgi:hypothetical protein
MPDEAFKWMGRIKAVEREYGAIRLGTDRLLVAVNDDPEVLEAQVRRPDIGTAAANLEGTYIIRVFAEFETALRHFLRAFRLRRPGSTEALVNRVRDRGHVPQAFTDAVHQVREYRNVLIHEYVGFDYSRVIEALQRLQPVREAIEELVEELTPVARRLGCSDELRNALAIMERGPSYIRQREVIAAGGAMTDVVDSLVTELRTDRLTPTPKPAIP